MRESCILLHSVLFKWRMYGYNLTVVPEPNFIPGIRKHIQPYTDRHTRPHMHTHTRIHTATWRVKSSRS